MPESENPNNIPSQDMLSQRGKEALTNSLVYQGIGLSVGIVSTAWAMGSYVKQLMPTDHAENKRFIPSSEQMILGAVSLVSVGFAEICRQMSNKLINASIKK